MRSYTYLSVFAAVTMFLVIHAAIVFMFSDRLALTKKMIEKEMAQSQSHP